MMMRSRVFLMAWLLATPWPSVTARIRGHRGVDRGGGEARKRKNGGKPRRRRRGRNLDAVPDEISIGGVVERTLEPTPFQATRPPAPSVVDASSILPTAPVSSTTTPPLEQHTLLDRPDPFGPAFQCTPPEIMGLCTSVDPNNMVDECEDVGAPCPNGFPGEYCCVDFCNVKYCTAKGWTGVRPVPAAFDDSEWDDDGAWLDDVAAEDLVIGDGVVEDLVTVAPGPTLNPTPSPTSISTPLVDGTNAVDPDPSPVPTPVPTEEMPLWWDDDDFGDDDAFSANDDNFGVLTHIPNDDDFGLDDDDTPGFLDDDDFSGDDDDVNWGAWNWLADDDQSPNAAAEELSTHQMDMEVGEGLVVSMSMSMPNRIKEEGNGVQDVDGPI